MVPLRFSPPALLAALIAVGFPAFAQVNTEFKITKVDTAFQDSPSFGGVRYDKRVTKPSAWLEVETTFEWLPRLKDPKYTDELTINYYILLTNKTQQYPQGALLTGSVTHVNVPQGKDLRSVVYVSPRALERFFDGKTPGNAGAAVSAVGVTISKQGQVVAEYIGGNFKSQWWTAFTQVPGYVLNKNETPFAPLSWDYYEAIKAKAPGL